MRKCWRGWCKSNNISAIITAGQASRVSFYTPSLICLGIMGFLTHPRLGVEGRKEAKRLQYYDFRKECDVFLKTVFCPHGTEWGVRA